MRELCYNKDMKKPLYKNYIATPIGQMMSISDAEFLYRLDFTDQKDFQGKLQAWVLLYWNIQLRFHVN